MFLSMYVCTHENVNLMKTKLKKARVPTANKTY